MKFSKTHLTIVSILAFLTLLIAGSTWADVMNPERKALAELQAKRSQNEILITELKAEHDKVVALRDTMAVKLGEMNEHIKKVEEKAKLAREANENITRQIENGGKE